MRACCDVFTAAPRPPAPITAGVNILAATAGTPRVARSAGSPAPRPNLAAAAPASANPPT